MKNLVKSNEVEKSEQNYIYSAKDIWELSNSSSRTWDNFVADFLIATDCDQKRDYLEEHASRSGGNKYTEKTLKAFQTWLMKNQANQGRASDTIKEATTQAVEKDLVITEVIKSGNVEAFNQLMNQYKLAFDTAQENKRLLEQTKQMEHALNYTAVIGWKKWSDLKRELAQNFEIFQHRISFKTVAAEAGLVKETDYAERIFAEDCFPTTMVSESGIDKIYDCYDR